MEHTDEAIAMLHQIPSPAFFVKKGTITAVNEPAKQHLITVGSSVLTLLNTGAEEYAQFRSGCLYLTLRICDVVYSACVTAVGEEHLFSLEQDADQAELQSMALIAKILRSPLSNVMAAAEHLFPVVSQDSSPEAQDQMAKINRGLYQMLRVVCNMSDAYRYTDDNVFRSEVRDVPALIREYVSLAASVTGPTGVELRYDGIDEKIFSLVDIEKMERALGNIISNAIKFAPKGSFVNIRLTRCGKMLYLTVQDQGEGLTAPVRANLYERYHRIPGIEDNRFGLGLGMVMIRNAATAHGGTVLTEDGKDFGLRLTMTLPIRLPSDPQVRSPMIHVDYAGEFDHFLLELADCLPAESFLPN